LLHLLINEEMKHKKMIENKIQQLSKYWFWKIGGRYE
jgi:rubrerythrin